MFKYTNAFTNRSGDSLPGYFARLYDSGGNLVSIYADASETPISTVSGVANAALSDENGMFRWYVANGTYDIRFYDANDVFVSVETGVPMVDADALTTDLAASGGAALVGHKRSSAAILRSLYAEANDTIPLTDYHVGDGTDATAAFAAAVADAVTEGKRLILPRTGHYLCTDAPIALDGLRMEGDGEGSRFTVGANDSNIFFVTGADVRMSGMKFEGDDTTSNSGNGNGILLYGANFLLSDCLFSGFGHGAIRGYASATKRGAHIRHTSVRDQGADGVDFLFQGAWVTTIFEDLDCVNTGSAAQGVGMFEDTGLYWQYCEIRGGRFDGYSKWGVAAADETWDGSDRVYGFVVNKGFYKGCGQAAIKAKLSKGVQVDGSVIEDCGGTLENGPAGLYGAILINSIGQMNVSNTIIRDAHHGAINFGGNDGPPKSYPGGYGLPSIVASGNLIEGVDTPTAGYGNGITILGRVSDVRLIGNSIRGAARYGVYADGTSPNGIKHVTSIGNYVADSASTQYAYRFSYINSVQVSGDEGFNFGGVIAAFENCYSAKVDASTRYHDSGGASCVLVVSTVKFTFDGAADNSFYDAWASSTAVVVGQRCSLSGNAYECTLAGTTAGSGGPTGADPLVEVTDGTAKWAYIHKHRQNTNGITFSGTAPQIARIGAAADFSYVPTSTSGAPSNLKRANLASGTATLAAGTVAVVINAEEDAAYKINLSGSAAETFSWASKTTTGFTINSSNAGSTALVDWQVYR